MYTHPPGGGGGGGGVRVAGGERVASAASPCSLLPFFLSFFYALIHYSNINTHRHGHTESRCSTALTKKERKKERGAIMNSGGLLLPLLLPGEKGDEEAQ